MWEIYWMTRLPVLGDLLVVIAIVIFAICFFLACIYDDFRSKEDRYINIKSIVILAVLAVVFIIVACFFPSKEDLALMYGWKAINSETSNEILDLIKQKYLVK